MNRNQQDELIREYPIALWITGLIFFTGGIVLYIRVSPIAFVVGGVGIGLLLVALSTVLVVGFNQSRTSLIIKHTGLLRRKTQELPMGEIQNVFVQQSRNRDSDSSATYRVVVVMENGEVIPLRRYYSGGYQVKEKTARRLREAIGVGGQDEIPIGMMEMASQMVQEAYQVNGETLGEMEEQETQGVRWQMQTVTLGATPVTRWLSTDFIFEAEFLYLVQTIEDRDSGKWMMALLGKTLMRQSLRLYGFTEEDFPNWEDGVVLEDLDKRLNQLYLGYASDPVSARRLLNSWVVRPLVDWAERFPLRQVAKQREDFRQLAILFSPNGVYVSCLGELVESETEELVALGVEIVKALG